MSPNMQVTNDASIALRRIDSPNGITDLCYGDHSGNSDTESIQAKLIEKGIDINDPLGLLQSSKHVAAAATDAMLASHSRKRKYKTNEEKLEANRKSAAESRHRKKMLMMHLQEKVSSLRQENTLLRSENQDLKKVFLMLQSQKTPFQSFSADSSNVLDSVGSSMTQLAMARNALSQNPLTQHISSSSQGLSFGKHQLNQDNQMRMQTQVSDQSSQLILRSNFDMFSSSTLFCSHLLTPSPIESIERTSRRALSI